MKREIKLASYLTIALIFTACEPTTVDVSGDGSSEPTKISINSNSQNNNQNSTAETAEDLNSNVDLTDKNSDDNTMIYEGQLVDAPVKGVEYKCGDIDEFTDDEGFFRCVTLPVKFGVGDTTLGEIEKLPEDKIVTLQDLAKVPRGEIDNPKVAKLAVFLQSLDDDGNITEVINIDRELASKLKRDIDIQQTPVQDIQKFLKSAGVKHIVSEDEALKHLKEHIKYNREGVEGKNHYVEVKGKDTTAKNGNQIPDSKKDRVNDTTAKNGNQIPDSKKDRVKDTTAKNGNQIPDSKNDRVKDTTAKNGNQIPDSKKDRVKDTTAKNGNQTPDSKNDRVKDTTAKNGNQTPDSKNENKEAKRDNPKEQNRNNQEQEDSKDKRVDNSSESKNYLKVSDSIYINDKRDVAIYVDSSINKNEKLIYNSKKVQEITKNIYNYFGDDYDFIFLVTNNKERPEKVTYAGVFNKIKNDVKGIGAAIYNNSQNYGSNGKLKGIMHFAYRQAILRGPTLHEICHYWANKFPRFEAKSDGSDGYRLGSSSHWGYTGFFGGKGQLGGYDASTNRAKYENREYNRESGTWKLYSAKSFGWNANGGNRVPYNDVELYLMGMIPKSDVKDLMVPIPWGSSLSPDEKNDVRNNNIAKAGRTYFVAMDIIKKSWSDILSEHNIPDREPSVEHSQKKFRILTVLLDTKIPEPFEVDIISSQIEKLAFKGDDKVPTNYNFWEATRGKGTLTVDKIDESLTTSAEEVKVDDNFESEKITFRGKIYKTIKSPYTGKIWLDRNIGASKVCESFTDTDCYGDRFQFGRGFDGHQKDNSPTTKDKKSSIDGNDDKYVLVNTRGVKTDWLKDGVDDDLSLRLAKLRATDGTGVCPAGFRVPTANEWKAETSYNERGDKFPGDRVSNNFLKLPKAGYRNGQSISGKIEAKGTKGSYWTSSSYKNGEEKIFIKQIFFDDSGAMFYGTKYFCNGETVRCIKAE